MNNEHELNLRIKQLEDALEATLGILSDVDSWDNYIVETLDEAYTVLHGGG